MIPEFKKMNEIKLHSARIIKVYSIIEYKHLLSFDASGNLIILDSIDLITQIYNDLAHTKLIFDIIFLIDQTMAFTYSMD